MLLHYLLAVINYIHRYESGIIWETKQYACLRKLDYQKTFCSNNNSVERRKKKNFKTKEKRTASLFSREKWMFVRILPFIRFFFKDLKTWSNIYTLVISSRSTEKIVCTHLKQNQFRFYIYQAILKRVFTLGERILNKVMF